MEKPATSTAGWKRHKQQNALALWGFAILCEWRTIGPRCKVSAWLLTDLCMPSPRQARLGTLPSLSFSPISSTNLLGAMKELNSFATLSLPKCHYHNVPQPDRPPRPALPAYRFLHGEVEGERPLTFSGKQHPERESEVGSVVLESWALVCLCYTLSWVSMCWRDVSDENTDLSQRGTSGHIWKHPHTFIHSGFT